MQGTVMVGKIHKWAGLVAALWLAVLAVTGLMQLHRQEWSWLWTSGPALDESIVSDDDKQLWRHHQVDPRNPRMRVASGAAGAWLSRDGGKQWQRLAFGTHLQRNVLALETTDVDGRWTVYAGTNDGVWRMDAAGSRMLPAGLQGQAVGSLSTEGQRLLAEVDGSRLYLGVQGGNAVAWSAVALGPLGHVSPAAVDLGRFLQDIHVGRGLFGERVDHVLWTVSAVGLLLLCLTGVLYWASLRWQTQSRKRPKEKRPTPQALRRAQDILRWTFRGHAMVIGIALALPLLIIFLTGLYQDHRTDLQMRFRQIQVPSALLPPSYRGSDWHGQIGNVGLGRDDAGEFMAIGNRRGVFISRDAGATWQRDKGFMGPAMRMRSVGGELFVPGRMMRRVQVRRDGHWQVLQVPPPVVMANELSAGPGGMLWWQRGGKIFRTTVDGEARGVMPHSPPRIGYLPWGSFFTELHKGALFSSKWKWVNDLFALMGIALVITGFLRWLKRRW